MVDLVSKAEELLSSYDDAVAARGAAVSRGESPFDKPLTPAETLATEVYRLCPRTDTEPLVLGHGPPF